MYATCLILLPGFFHPPQSSATKARKTTSESIKKFINVCINEKTKKVRFFLHAIKAYGGVEVQLHAFLNSALNGGPFIPWERALIHI
jgi:hypothetical protein